MRHRVAYRKLGRTTPHRLALLRNLATALFDRERIRTTLAKAKELHKELGMNELICWFNPGGLVPHQKVLTAMSRFAAEIMPELRLL